jgi:extracellular elastinolytic metalloproteinase
MARTCPGGRARLWRVVTPVALILLAVALPSAGHAVGDVRDAQHQELSDLDARGRAVAPSAAQRALARTLHAGVSWNTYGTPQSIYRTGGFLGRPQAGTAAAAARGWLAAHKRLFRLDSLAGLRLVRGSAIGRNGHVVIFRQLIGGSPLVEGGLATVGLRRVGKRWAVVHVSSTLTGENTIRGSTRLGAKEAWLRAARSVGHRVAGLVELRTNMQGYTLMRASGLDGVQTVRRALVALPKVGVVPAFETVVEDQSSGDTKAYRIIVDARTGKVVLRRSLVQHLSDNPRWGAFPASPPIGGGAYPWNYPTTDTRDIWCWNAGPACELAVSGGSPHLQVPWDTIPPGPGTPGTPTFTTMGNNATNQEAWIALPMGFPGPNSYRPVSTTREYLYPWTNAWFEGLCSPTLLTPVPPTAATGNTNDLNAAIVNLFAMHNRVHDFSFHLGFDEERWNAQEVNTNNPPRRPWNAPGTPSLPLDEVQGNAQAAAISGGPPNYGGRDNANMTTRDDGVRSTTNMFLWQPLAGTFYAPCVDGDYDMSVIGHEYGHMIENRMIGKGDQRSGHHAGAMGESFGDLNAMEYLNEYGFVPVSGENQYSVGPYVTSNKYRAIRNYGMNFPYSGGIPRPGRYPFVNALNFSDIGYDFVGAQVHADGEIWSATNFDIRRLLLAKYPGSPSRQRECADGQQPPLECPGNRRWFQLYYDAMVLMPTRPSMLDARNAILAADVMRFGGANQEELWYAFATRGFGQSATVSTPPAPPPPPGGPRTPADDPQPKPAFDSPQHDETVVRFRAVARDEGNAPVNATVYVGHYEARVSPIADTNPATGPADGTAATADTSNLDNVASFTSRSYEFVAHAEGYGHLRFRADLKPGQSRMIMLHFATNWASKHKGAVATGEGTRLDALIDDTENSNWEFTGRPVNVAPHPTVTVALAPGKRKIDRANVSAFLVPTVGNDEMASATQNRFTALRQFELRACRAGADSGNPTCDGTNPAGWDVIYHSASSFFPGDTPRPVAPELLLRGFDFGSQWATHVQFVVLNNQCTGNTAFQGEQDNDPVMVTDCRTGSPHNLVNFPPRGSDVRAAELQVYSSEHHVSGAVPAEDGDE